MKTSLDCIPCFFRQTLEAARMTSTDPDVHERILREVLRWVCEMDIDTPPPVLGQRIHRRIREITGVRDPYRAAKDRWNRRAMTLLPEIKARLETAANPLEMAVRLAIAGNVIDMGVNSSITEADLSRTIDQALEEPLVGDMEQFLKAAAGARSILYLADNAGEIVFDRLLIEQISPSRITLAVRGAPVINDATIDDARAAGLHEIVQVIDNGSDAPGTVLEDCSPEFRCCFEKADLIIAKGQGNFETLSDENRNIVFLFKAKCSVIAAHIGLPVGSHVVATTNGLSSSRKRKQAGW
jgi:hypothetical protein